MGSTGGQQTLETEAIRSCHSVTGYDVLDRLRNSGIASKHDVLLKLLLKTT